MSPERLLELKEALLFGDPLDAEARLDLLAVLQEAAALVARRGRPVDRALQRRASVAGLLVEKHHVPLKAAIFAAAPGAGESERRSIERTYRTLRDGGDLISVPHSLVAAALAVVKKNVRRK